MARVLFLAPILAIKAIAFYYVFLKSPPPVPNLDVNAWWGPEELKGKQDVSVKPFEIKFDDKMIQDLKQRLKSAREFVPPLEGIKTEYGFNTKELSNWLEYWANEYPFAARQKFLNQYKHYKTNIQGLNIHFIRVTPKVPAGVELVPLLLLHGWPGSVREFYEAIPLLTAVEKGRNFALELIVPSLPGYGYSDAAVRPGLGAPEMSILFRNLMQRLGFKKYYVQGGDWGAIICNSLITFFPDEVLGYHSNMAFFMSNRATMLEFLGSIYPPLILNEKEAKRIYPLSTLYSRLLQETGYMHLQSTKPDTVGVSLADSPAGLLAYVLEKFSTWTDHGIRPVLEHFTKEQLIDNLMFYWTTNSMTTAMRLYAETFNKKFFEYQLEDIPSTVPVWALQAKYELSYQPSFILKLKFPNLVGTTFLDDGGHFMALQLPKVYAIDVLNAIGEFRKLQKTKKTEL